VAGCVDGWVADDGFEWVRLDGECWGWVSEGFADWENRVRRENGREGRGGGGRERKDDIQDGI